MAAPPSDINHNESIPLPPEAIQAWKLVEEGVGKPVFSSRLIQAMEFANEFYNTHLEARDFVTQYLATRIVHTLVILECKNEDTRDYKDVEDCLKLAATIAVKEMRFLDESEKECNDFPLLSMLFDRSNTYYQEDAGRKTRIRVIDTFQCQGGFVSLARVLSRCHFSALSDMISFMAVLVATVSDLIEAPPSALEISLSMVGTMFGKKDKRYLSTLENLYSALRGLDASDVSAPTLPMPSFTSTYETRKEETMLVAQTLVGWIHNPNLSLEGLQLQEHLLSWEVTLKILDKIMDRATDSAIREFHRLFMDLSLRFISSESEDLKLFGWCQLVTLACSTRRHRPPPRTITVTNAENSLVNGVYVFTGVVDEREDFSYGQYEKTSEESGLKCVLFPHVTKGDDGVSTLAWRLLASSTTNDNVEVHYITKRDSVTPPINGWKSFNTGTDSPLSLNFGGLVVPPGEECNTLEHELAHWVISNKLIERFYNEGWCLKYSGSFVGYLRSLLISFTFVKSNTANDNHCLQVHHVLQPWNMCIKAEDETDTIGYCQPLVYLMIAAPDNVAMRLLAEIRGRLNNEETNEAAAFFLELVDTQSTEKLTKFPSFQIEALSNEVQSEIKRVMWSTRTRMCGMMDKKDHDDWMKLETFRPFIEQADVVPSLTVSVTDLESRMIQVTMPIESSSGEYVVGIRVFASCNGCAESIIVQVEREAIEKIVKARSDRIVLDAVLPEAGVWSISTQGLLHRKGLVESPRSEKATVDLSSKDSERPVLCDRVAVDSLDEQARQNAGDIQSTIRKLRGPCSGQMTTESKYSLLNTAVVHGRSTLNALKSLVGGSGCDEDSVPGVADALAGALSEANLPMKELEAGLNQASQQEGKGKGIQVTCVCLALRPIGNILA